MIDNAFTHVWDRLLRGFGPRQARPRGEPAGKAHSPAEHRAQWFAGYAAEHVMPLLRQAAEGVKRHGSAARCWLDDSNGTVRAMLEIVPPGLPKHVHPPRLTISAADADHLLSVDYTGTFPGAGASGGFGAEIEYDTIHLSQIEDEIDSFVALATAA